MQSFRLLPFVLVCLVGCGGPSLSGKYSVAADGMPPGTKIVMEFNSGKYTQTVDADAMGMKLHSDTTGTYTYDGKKIVMTITDIKVGDSNLPAAAKEQMKAQIEAGKSKPQESEVKIDGENMTFTTNGKAITLTKIK